MKNENIPFSILHRLG